MTSIFKFGGRHSTIRQILMTLLVASTVAITVSGAGSAQAATPGKDAASNAAPQATCPAGGQCFADVPSSNGFYDFVNRGYGVIEIGPTEAVCELKKVDAKTPGASTPTTIAKFRAPLGARIPEQIG